MKKSLSYYIGLAKSGALIVVFDRDVPVARLSSFLDWSKDEQKGMDTFSNERLKRLEKSGQIRVGKNAFKKKLPIGQPVVHLDVDVLKLLDEDREEGAV